VCGASHRRASPRRLAPFRDSATMLRAVTSRIARRVVGARGAASTADASGVWRGYDAVPDTPGASSATRRDDGASTGRDGKRRDGTRDVKTTRSNDARD